MDQTAADETLVHDGLRAIEKLGPDDPTAEAARTHLGTSLAALREELEHDEAFQGADAAARAQQERATPER